MELKTTTEGHLVRRYDAVPIQPAKSVGAQEKTMTPSESIRFWLTHETVLILGVGYKKLVVAIATVKSLFRRARKHPRFAEIVSTLTMAGYLAIVTALAALFTKP